MNAEKMVRFGGHLGKPLYPTRGCSQHALTADRVEYLQQERPQQLLRRDRRTTDSRIQAFKGWRQLNQRLVNHRSQRLQRVAFRNPLLQRKIAEHRSLPPVVSTHLSPSRIAIIYRNPGFFSSLLGEPKKRLVNSSLFFVS